MPLVFLIVLATFSLFCNAEQWPAEQWPERLAPRSPALDELQRYSFPPRDDASRNGVRTDGLLVIRDGQVIYERYSAPTSASTAHATWSISKSLLATVLGVAFSEGRFALQDAVVDYYQPFRKHPDVRLQDLLHWASGLDWQEDYEYAPLNSSVVAMLYTRGRTDMAAYAAQCGRFSAPGRQFRYSSGDSNVLAAVLKNLVGAHDYPNYPWRALFEPLGIHHAVWETDATGTFVASSYAYLTARDLARVGLLMLRDGRWRQRQLLPPEWVAFNRTPFAHATAEPGEATPGGHWWLNRAIGAAPRPWPSAPEDTFAALGHWGQGLYILPKQKLVIVRYGDDRDGSFSHDALLERVLAAFPEEAGQ
ncbi:serine hydrolase domain-containing protein [Pseudomonas sp. nanlin1]|uniref:serine hydrolase domain-containing protein n=1 Tax=Pseudomonas sp. nanlin1 TaxID=3040605 RepID=UPI0038908428